MLTTFTDPEYYAFVCKFVFASVLLPALLFMCMSRLLRGRTGLSPKVLLLLSLGIGPGLVSLLLYYLLLLAPGLSPKTAFAIITALFLAMGVYGRSEFKTWWRTIINGFGSLISWFTGLWGRLLLAGTVIFLLLTFVYLNYYLMSKQITEHDTLEYTIQGDIFYRDMAIGYSAHRYDEVSGFYYVGLHGFTFPLIKTWDNIMNDTLGLAGDHYFRVTNMFYGTLLLLLMFALLYRYNALLAVIGFVATFLTYGFFETYMKYHIDNMRVFFLVCAVMMLYECIKHATLPNILLLGLLMGLQANSHSLGALISVIELGTLFFFLPLAWAKRFTWSALVLLLMLGFGGIHYVLDVAIGTGWILQEVKFY